MVLSLLFQISRFFPCFYRLTPLFLTGFDDGDERTLNRNAVRVKGEAHFKDVPVRAACSILIGLSVDAVVCMCLGFIGWRHSTDPW